MIDGIITSVGEKIKAFFQSTIGHWISLDWVPELVWWYGWLFVLLVVVLLIIKLFGWARFVHIGASMLLLLGAVFVAGGHFMKRRIEAADAKKAAKAKPRPKLPAPPTDSWFPPFGR